MISTKSYKICPGLRVALIRYFNEKKFNPSGQELHKLAHKRVKLPTEDKSRPMSMLKTV